MATTINLQVNQKCLYIRFYLYLSLKEREIPIEIDDHFRLYGKEPWEVEYGEKCPVCNVRIDEYGFCSCGSCGE